MIITKKCYEIKAETSGKLVFLKDDKPFFAVPMAVTVSGTASRLELESCGENEIVYLGDGEKMTASLLDDCVMISYRKTAKEDMPIGVVKAFIDEGRGMTLFGFDRAFSPQPRNNAGKNMDYYHRLPDISVNGYFSPPMLQMSIGSPSGWVSLGLLDIPDTKICKLDDDFSFLIESCGGNKVIKKGEDYCMPRVLISFPKDEWSAIDDFRKKLEAFGLYEPKLPDFSDIPSWWKNPFVCTYGDQLIERRVGQKIDEEWVKDFVDVAERDWGHEQVNLIIDDSWQLSHSMEPIADKERFPDLRRLIDDLHERGHHVILWITPLFDKTTNGFVTRAKKMGVLSEYEYKPPVFGTYFDSFPGCYAIDYTSDNAREFVKAFVSDMFGSGEGQFNADGVKLDFLGTLRDPAQTKAYAHPERGIGLTELKLFYEMFYQEARKIKPDVLIDSSVGDPRFEHLISFNRLHDTHCGYIEKEMRARISSLGCPKLPIDSDGALMFNSWLKNHYISAAIYSVPSNYYLKVYHDFYASRGPEKEFGDLWDDIEPVELTKKEKLQFGNLFSMVKHRPNGRAIMRDFGSWELWDEGKVNAVSQKGETVVYYPEQKGGTGYIFTFQNEVIVIPLHGRKLSKLSPEPKGGYLETDYARDIAIMRLNPGVVHTFVDEDDGTSVDRMLSMNMTEKAEEDMNYVNG